MDIGRLPAPMDSSLLLPRDKGILKDSTLTQWSMLKANGKALKSAIAAEARGFLRAGDAPRRPFLSEVLYNPQETAVTANDVLRSLGLPSSMILHSEDAEAVEGPRGSGEDDDRADLGPAAPPPESTPPDAAKEDGTPAQAGGVGTGPGVQASVDVMA